eukprot:SAG31_NODE_22_length_33849_cov_13.713096_15_plen_198_part_00
MNSTDKSTCLGTYVPSCLLQLYDLDRYLQNSTSGTTNLATVQLYRYRYSRSDAATARRPPHSVTRNIFYKSMVLVWGAIFFHFCDPTSLEKVAKMPPKGFVVQNKCATSRLQCPNFNSRGKTWPIDARESTLLNVVVERWPATYLVHKSTKIRQMCSHMSSVGFRLLEKNSLKVRLLDPDGRYYKWCGGGWAHDSPP